MLSWLRTTFGVKAASSPKVAAIKISPDTPISEFTNYADYLKVASGEVWATWKAIDIIAEKVKTTPFALSRPGSTKPVDNKELMRLLTYPNQYETFQELIYKSVFHLKLTGCSIWYKAAGTLTGDRPLELYALNPKRIKFIPKHPYGVAGYLLRTSLGEVPFDPEEIIMFRRPHPDNDFLGIGDVEAGKDVFTEVRARQAYQRKFYENGARPSGLLSYGDSITEEEWKKLKIQWDANYAGSGNAGKTIFLTGKWDYKQLGLTLADMQDMERARLSTETIFQLHGVPLSVAGIREAANYATSAIDNQRFKEYTVLPLVKTFEETLNTDLVAGFDQAIRLAFNVSGLVDVGKAVGDYSPLFDRGCLTPNEFREQCGLKRIDDNPLMDAYYINSGLVPLDLSGIGDTGKVDQAAQRSVDRFLSDLQK